MSGENWYTNKQLFEMINDLKLELVETTKLIKEYNGLRKNQNEFEERLTKIETCVDNKKESKKDWQWFAALLIGIVMGIISKIL